MTYLSQILVGKGEAARDRLWDSYSWHRKLWDAFPGRPDASRSFLFRVDDKRDDFRILLLSLEHPVAPDWGRWHTKEVAASFLAHDCYRFQLRANPTVKRVVRLPGGDRKKNGRRTGIYDEASLLAWLERKAGESGFRIAEAVAGPPQETHFVKEGKKGKHNAVDFQGVLRILHREAFARAFHQGIGPAKAFGFGLLMLEPVA